MKRTELSKIRGRLVKLETAVGALIKKAESLCSGCDLGEKFDGDSHKSNYDGPHTCHIDEMGPAVYDLRRIFEADALQTVPTVLCGVEFYRRDLAVNSTCGRNKGHPGEHSWYNDPEEKNQ